MKIIDAHMHFSKAIPSFAPMAEQVGHLYTEEHLQTGGSVIMKNVHEGASARFSCRLSCRTIKRTHMIR